MSTIITSTADVLAILGGVTTFTAAVFAAVRLSRCQKVLCCWGGCQLENKPLPTQPPSIPAPAQPALTRDDSVDMGGIV